MVYIKIVFLISRGRKEHSAKNLQSMEEILNDAEVKRLFVVYAAGELTCLDIITPHIANPKLIPHETKLMPTVSDKRSGPEIRDTFLRGIENEALKKGCNAILFLAGNSTTTILANALAWYNDDVSFVAQKGKLTQEPDPGMLISIKGDEWTRKN